MGNYQKSYGIEKNLVEETAEKVLAIIEKGLTPSYSTDAVEARDENGGTYFWRVYRDSGTEKYMYQEYEVNPDADSMAAPYWEVVHE